MAHADGRPIVPEVSVQEAHKRVDDGHSVIVDVRENEELAEVSVPGAVHIPLGSLPQRLGELPEDRELLFLCRSGNRSSYATDFAMHSGHPDAKNITGGIIAWVKAGLPLQEGNG